MSRILRACGVLVVLVVAGCGGEGGGDGEQPAREATAPKPGEPRVETVATDLEVPWEIAFLPDERALITERPGRIRLLERDGRLRREPVGEIAVSAVGEGGLLGLALDPEFERNRLLYLYYTTPDGMKLARARFENDRVVEEAIVLDGIRAGPIHDSGRIAFGPDEQLYVATGDAGNPELAQEPGSLNGKFLRLALEDLRGDGGAPQVVSLGHRNPQGLSWSRDNRQLHATEHGSTGCDEVNLIRGGRNYGWPRVRCDDHGRFAAPLVIWEDTIAPSGATFVHRGGSAWTGDFLVAALAGEQIRRVTFDGARVTRNEPMFEGRFGRLRTVVEGPDGALYVLTSNRDGRGSPTEQDDRVLRIVPPAR